MSAELAIIARLQDEASSGIRALRGEVEGLGDSGGIAAKGFGALQAVGTAALIGLAGAVTAAAAATALFVKSAIQAGIEFESAFAGVIKTVDGVVNSGGALTAFGQQLRDDFRQLALEIPIALNELARIGELGGQLGIAGEDLIAFTELIAKLGVTTNLSTEEAAMSFAQFGNIMQSSQEDLTRFGSAVVYLGNNFATTEADIVAFATRIAGAGAIAGMTEADIAGVAAAFSSVGVQAEAGGSAVQKVLIDINTAVVTGGSQLETYARAAGMTAQEFAAAWRNDPGQAFTQFVNGLGAAGDEAVLILDDLGLADARLVRAFLSVAQAGDLLGRAIEGSNQAFIDNMALAREAALRFQTVESQMILFKNVINDVKISLYDALRPAIVAIIAALTTFIAGVAPQVRAMFEALGAAVGQFVTALLQGQGPIGALVDAIFRFGQELGMPMDRLAELRAQLDGFMSAVGAVVGPILQAITSFVSWKDVLVALGIAIASVVIPVLYAIANAIVPVLAVFAGLILAVAAVRNAFETNFLGIRDLAFSLWAALQGVFEGIKALLSGDTTTAMAAFRSAWETGWNAVVGFIQNAGSQIGTALQGLWQSIVAWFQGIDWGSLGQTLIDKFFAGMATLGQASAGRWEWLLTSITSFIQSVDWGKLGYTLIDLLIKGIVGAVGLIGTALAGIVTFIWNFITGTNWIELGVNLVNAIIDGLGSFGQGAAAALADWRQVIFDWAGAEDWAGVGEKVADLVGTALGDARDAVAAKLSEWKTAIFDWADAEDWAGVAETISEMVGTALGDAAESVADQLEAWRDAIFDWADAEDWTGVAETIIEMVGTALGDAADSVAERLTTWRDAIFDWADAEDWTGVAETISEMVGTALGDAADSVAERLTTWRDAIFDWAGAEDWAGVAETIAEIVGAALGDAASSVIATLDSWEQAIFDWADAADWAGVSETIASSVGDSLADVSDKVTEKLSGWITAFTDWVNSVDWYQVGYDIMFKITDAFLDFKEAISTKISTWLADTKTATEGYSWLEVGLYILQKIAEGAIGTVADWVGSVSAWVASLSAAVSQHIGNLMQVGRDLVAGIAAGIAAAGDLIQGAIAGVTAAAEPAARAASDSNSPSRLMMPVGYDLSAGIAVGISQGAGTIISAIKDVAGEMELEAVKSFAEAVKAIGEAIETAVRSYVLLTGFSGANTGGATAGLASIALFMKGLVDAFAEANTHGKEALDLVQSFVKTAEAIADLIGTALFTLFQLNAVSLNFDGVHILGQIQSVRDFIAALVNEFALAALELGYFGPLVEAFTAAAEGILGLLNDSLYALATLNAVDFSPYLGWKIESQVAVFSAFLQLLMRDFAAAAAQFSYMGEAIETFTGAAEGILDLLDGALNALATLNAVDFSAYFGWKMVNQVAVFVGIISLLMRDFAAAAAQFSFMGEAVETFTSAAEGILGLLDGALYSLAVLNAVDFSIYFGWKMVSQVAVFVGIISLLMRDFSEAAAQFGYMGEAVDSFTSAAEGVLGLLDGALYAMATLAAVDFSNYIQGWSLRDQIVILRNIVLTMVREFADAAAEFGYMGDSVESFADAANAVIELVAGALAAVVTLAEFNFGRYIDGWSLRDQIVILRNVIRTLVREFAEGAAEFGFMGESVETFADAGGSVVDLVSGALEAVVALSEFDFGPYVANWHLATQIETLRNVIRTLVREFAEGAAEFGFMSESVISFTEAGSAVIEIVSGALEAVVALAGFDFGQYIDGWSLRDQIVILRNVIRTLVREFADAAGELGTMSDAVSTFADAAGSVIDLVAKGIEAIALLATYNFSGDLTASIANMTGDLVTVLSSLVSGFQQAGLLANQAVIDAGEMGSSIEDLLGVVGPAIESVVLLVGYTRVSGIKESAAAFAADLVLVINALLAGLEQGGMLASQALVKAGEMAGSIEDLIKVVDPAIGEKGAFQSLVSYISSGNLIAQTQQFARDLVAVTQTLVDGLTQSTLALGIGLQKAGEMAKSIEELFKAVSEALDFIGVLSTYVSDKDIKAKAEKFSSDLIAVASTLVSGLSAASATLGAAAVGAAKKFTEDISAIVSEMHTFMSLLNEIADMKQPSLGPILAYIIASAQAIAAAANGTGVINGASEQFNHFADEVAEIVRGTFDALAQIEILAHGNAPGSVASILRDMLSAFNSGAATFNGAGRNLSESFISGWNGGPWTTAYAVVQNMLGSVMSQGIAQARGGTQIGEAFTSAIISGINAGSGAVIRANDDLIHAAIASASNVARGAVEAGRQIAQAMIEGLNSQRGAVDTAGLNTGSAMVNGLVRGLENGRSRVVSAATSIAKAAIDAANNALGIASPSKVFAYMGAQIPAGLAKGMSNIRPALEAIGNMVTKIGSTFTNAKFGTLPPITTALLQSSPVLRPDRLAGLANASTGGGTVVTQGGPVSVTITIDGGRHSLADIERRVETAVSNALQSQGRRADAIRRMS